MNKLVALTKGLPIGTNLALLQFIWMLVSGALLPQRGAIFPALEAIGLSNQATRRAWAAFRGGVWQTAVLLRLWQEQIEGLPGLLWGSSPGRLSSHHRGCDRLLATGAGKLSEQALSPTGHLYQAQSRRALPAVIFGVIGEVGEIGGQRIACPLAFERVHPKDPSEKRLWQALLGWVQRH